MAEYGERYITTEEEEVPAEPVKVSVSISRGKPSSSSLDFQFLRQKGIALLQKYSGNVWTDYNLHDPGVTILEQLIYALTDLAYRTTYPVEDLLATAPDGKIDPETNTFFQPEEILTTAPVTANDYRRLLIDQLKSIYNVWFEPVSVPHQAPGLGGMYRVLVQVTKEALQEFKSDSGFRKELENRIRNLLSAHRNLCEDIYEIVLLEPLFVTVEADVAIQADAEPEEALASIVAAIQEYFNPQVKSFSLTELLQKGFAIEDILNGPLMVNGYIPESELSERVTLIDVSEINKIISLAEGVSNVRSIQIIAGKEQTQHGVVFLPQNQFPVLVWEYDKSQERYPVRLYRDNAELVVNASRLADRMLEAKQGQHKHRRAGDAKRLGGILQGLARQLGRYTSLQVHFPLVYGIGYEGLPSGVSKARLSQAKQLKAFLMLFEQVMANYLAQLENLKLLFSASDQHRATLFSKPLYEVPEGAPLFRDFTRKITANPEGYTWEAFKQDDSNAYRQMLYKTREESLNSLERKIRLLDHLLARYNVEIDQHMLSLSEKYYGRLSAASSELFRMEARLEYLQKLSEITYLRNTGIDYYRPEDDLKGFELQLYHLLDIYLKARHSLASVFNADWVKINPAGSRTVAQAASRKPLEGEESALDIMISLEMMEVLQANGMLTGLQEAGSNVFAFRRRNFEGFRKVLKSGIDNSRYRIGPSPDGSGLFYLLYNEPGQDKWEVLSSHGNRHEAMVGMEKLTDQLLKFSLLSEGLYVVEHNLLAPLPASEKFGFQFLDMREEVLLQHSRYMNFSDRNQVLSLFLAGEGSRFSLENTAAGFRIHYLNSENNLVAQSPKTYINEYEAAKALRYLHASLQRMRQEPECYLPAFRPVVALSNGKLIQESFFSFRMSVVLPDWPARFQDSNFRDYADNLIRFHAPAHTGVAVQWLSYPDMARFEMAYKKLLASWQDGRRDAAETRQQAEELILMFAHPSEYV